LRWMLKAANGGDDVANLSRVVRVGLGRVRHKRSPFMVRLRRRV
jgi:hypothetical protein